MKKYFVVLLFLGVNSGKINATSLQQTQEQLLNSLAQINQKIWEIHQTKTLLIAQYEKQIVAIQKRKIKALQKLLKKHEQNLVKRKKLIQEIKKIESEIAFSGLTTSSQKSPVIVESLR